jgi:hypothetical protein
LRKRKRKLLVTYYNVNNLVDKKSTIAAFHRVSIGYVHQ